MYKFPCYVLCRVIYDGACECEYTDTVYIQFIKKKSQSPCIIYADPREEAVLLTLYNTHSAWLDWLTNTIIGVTFPKDFQKLEYGPDCHTHSARRTHRSSASLAVCYPPPPLYLWFSLVQPSAKMCCVFVHATVCVGATLYVPVVCVLVCLCVS